MGKIQLGFDPEFILKDLERENWEYDRESDTMQRSVGLGSVFSITPSGKVYTPFAHSNLTPCPGCNGKGTVRSRVKRRIVRKWVNAHWRLCRAFRVHLIDHANEPAQWKRARRKTLAAARHRNRLLESTTCLRCAGQGSAEAYDDERWYELVEKELDKKGLYMTTSEGDGAYLIVVQTREPTEEERAEFEKEEGDDVPEVEAGTAG